MYDPTIGRWISEDPIGFTGADANLYRYVGNSPTNRTDPSGLVPDDEAGRIVDQVLNGTRPHGDIRALSREQLAAEIRQLQGAVLDPRGRYPAQMVSQYNEARIAFL